MNFGKYLENAIAALRALTVTTLTWPALPFTIIYSLSSGVFEVFSTIQMRGKISAICILGILSSGIAVMMFNKLIQMTSALFSSSGPMLFLWLPFYGACGMESILWNHLVGLLVIITGIYLINKK